MKTTTKIVIVDPNPCDYLSPGGQDAQGDLELHLLPTGARALRFAQHVEGAVWWINTRLPDMSGLELYRLLRRRLSGSPVTMVSDDYSVADELQVMSLGTAAYVSKPLDMHCLREFSQSAAAEPNQNSARPVEEQQRMVA